MKILVVGGAGYIGSHTVRCLLAAGHEVLAFDDLSQGHAAAVPAGLLVRGDLNDRAALDRTLAGARFDAVMHFAAFTSVPESVTEPAKYYRNNFAGTLNLLEAMRAAGVERLVFSSTAAVYGVAGDEPIAEDSPLAPINPYGVTKLAVERMLADFAQAYGLGFAVLRYFNACGAADDGSIGEDHRPETHLIPLVLQVALGQRATITVFGNDYPTPDGTCVRDYIHVEDLAEAHRVALERIESGRGLTYNIGTGQGASVLEIIEAARAVTGHSIPTVDAPRRPGDPPRLVASSRRLQTETGWRPRYREIREIIASAWAWHSAHPRGYDELPSSS